MMNIITDARELCKDRFNEFDLMLKLYDESFCTTEQKIILKATMLMILYNVIEGGIFSLLEEFFIISKIIITKLVNCPKNYKWFILDIT